MIRFPDDWDDNERSAWQFLVNGWNRASGDVRDEFSQKFNLRCWDPVRAQAEFDAEYPPVADDPAL